MLSTLGFVALVIGVVLLICGYVADARAVRPGWALTIIGAVLLLVAYLLPAIHVAAV